jgi:hypothetical protein
MASSEVRGFRYPLEPLRKRRGWELDLAMAAVAALRKQLDDKQATRQAVEDEAIAQGVLAARAWEQRGDPSTQTRMLAYLAQLQGRKAAIELAIAALHEQLVLAQQEAQRSQQQVEMLERHRKEELDLYRLGEQRKTIAEADRDWAMRVGLAQEMPR